MSSLRDSPLSSPVVPTLPPAPRAGFWQRRVRDPLLALLTQGATPQKLASAIAWGFVCSLFPFFGCTTGLNALVGLWRKLNQPLLQAINYALSPLHLVMILVYVRMGEWLWQAEDGHFTLHGMLESFHELSFGEFLREFGWVGAHAFTGWLASAPALFVIVYFPARAGLRRLSHLLPDRGRE
ncbi:DUF2062 domain-containing protein [bacterium]|jgi:uncharacterized protein (DUF2062 family)|nr:DUF2062 domain-containing protein [bacterium]